MLQHRIQGSRQLRTGSFQFGAVFESELTQHGAACRSEADPHFPLIVRARPPRDRARALETVDQLDRAVMPNEQSGGNLPNRGPGAIGQALNREKQLMLLRLKTVLFCSRFAEVKKLSDLPAEFGKVTVLRKG